MTPQQIHYMRLLIARIEQAPEDRIDMGTWGFRLEENCGTAGCAGGYALTIPELREAGLHGALSPCYGDRVGIAALRHFFGIKFSESFWLFHSGSYQVDPISNRHGSKDYLLRRLRFVLARYDRHRKRCLSEAVE